jgi:thiamine-monophosphate kinase
MVESTLAHLGELEILRRLQPFCAQAVGDDAMVQPLPAGTSLVVTTDVLVEGVHFSEQTMDAEALGWRCAAVNLSDLAAMGATPLGITVAASLPPTVPWPWLEGVYRGMHACLVQYGAQIWGGDLVRAPSVQFAITALGYVAADRALYRHRAQANQAIVVTGYHGASRAGLALLLQEKQLTEFEHLAQHQAQQWISAHQRPRPRFDAIATLQSLTDDFSTIAAMDSSDGLANAILQLCASSGIGAEVSRALLPSAPGLTEWVGPEVAEQWTLYGGEDFELVLCLPWPLAQALVSKLGCPCRIIGKTTLAQDVKLINTLDNTIDLIDPMAPEQPSPHADLTAKILTLGDSYQHFGHS